MNIPDNFVITLGDVFTVVGLTIALVIFVICVLTLSFFKVKALIWLGMTKYNSLAELNEEWEDCEEPKEHWCVTMYGGITRIKDDEEPIDDLIEIGNYFNSKEDAYDAWGKLKAWKRLQDKGFRFILDEETEMPMFIYSGANGEKCITNAEESKQCRSDIKLLFGGEE